MSYGRGFRAQRVDHRVMAIRGFQRSDRRKLPQLFDRRDDAIVRHACRSCWRQDTILTSRRRPGDAGSRCRSCPPTQIRIRRERRSRRLAGARWSDSGRTQNCPRSHRPRSSRRSIRICMPRFSAVRRGHSRSRWRLPPSTDPTSRARSRSRGARASIREVGDGPNRRHRATFHSADAAALRDLFHLVGHRDTCDVLVDGRPLPYARELWLPLVWFLLPR